MIWSQSFPTERATFWHSKQHKHPEGCFSHIWKLVWFHWDGKEYLTSVCLTGYWEMHTFPLLPTHFSVWLIQLYIPLQSWMPSSGIRPGCTLSPNISWLCFQDRTPGCWPHTHGHVSLGQGHVLSRHSRNCESEIYVSSVFFFFSARLLIG